MTTLTILQIIVSVLLVVFILIQQKGSALGSSFGGGGSSSLHTKRRGMEKNIFVTTIVLAALFIGISILNLLV